MYGSYASYSSMAAVASPMDIGPGYNSSRSADDSCAFPSWPRRQTLSESDRCGDDGRATSYLSDEDLFPSDPFDASASDDASSISSNSPFSSGSSSPHLLTETDMLEIERQRQAYQRDVMRFLVSEKERRRQQMRRQRQAAAAAAAYGKKTANPKGNRLSAITE